MFVSGTITGHDATYPIPPMCPDITSAGAADAIYKVTPAANTTLRFQINNPAHGFASGQPVIAVYDGTNGDPLTAGEVGGATIPLSNTNESRTNGVQDVTIGGTVVYTGNTFAMRSDYPGGGSPDVWDEENIWGLPFVSQAGKRRWRSLSISSCSRMRSFSRGSRDWRLRSVQW
jgi:hypothetical protein